MKDLNIKEIAKLELEQKVIPLYIERNLPGGKVEQWFVNELINQYDDALWYNYIILTYYYDKLLYLYK